MAVARMVATEETRVVAAICEGGAWRRRQTQLRMELVTMGWRKAIEKGEKPHYKRKTHLLSNKST